MPSHKLQKDWKAKLKAIVPFGLGQTKPKHFRDMAAVLWKNRDNLPYAWKVLRRGVCDGCALGVAGFHDWTIEGIHLCMTRLNLLRLNTMPALDVKLLENISKLRPLNNAQLRELGRLPYPMLREKDAPGFRRISWNEAYNAWPTEFASSNRSGWHSSSPRAESRTKSIIWRRKSPAFLAPTTSIMPLGSVTLPAPRP